MSTMTSETTVDQYCTFWVGGHFFGVPVDVVQEVLRHQPVTAIPRAPAGVTGLLNLRGQIVPAVDLYHCLGLGTRQLDTPQVNVIVHSRGESVSLLVDRIGDVVNAGDHRLETTPPTIQARARESVIGVQTLHDAVLLVLDADRVIDAALAPTA